VVASTGFICQKTACITAPSRYDRKSGEWALEKAPVYHIID
jgi:hypothetical protein